MLKNLTPACLLVLLHFTPVVAWAQSPGYGMLNNDAALNTVVGLVVALVVAIGVFLIIREIVCWYWKLNEIVNGLKEVNTNLRDLRQEISGSSKVNL